MLPLPKQWVLFVLLNSSVRFVNGRRRCSLCLALINFNQIFLKYKLKEKDKVRIKDSIIFNL